MTDGMYRRRQKACAIWIFGLSVVTAFIGGTLVGAWRRDRRWSDAVVKAKYDERAAPRWLVDEMTKAGDRRWRRRKRADDCDRKARVEEEWDRKVTDRYFRGVP